MNDHTDVDVQIGG